VILAIIGEGVFPYNPLVLIDGGIIGVLVVLPVYYYWLTRTYQKARRRADAGGTPGRMIIPAMLPLVYGVLIIIWAFQESVWFGYTSTYGTTVGGVRVGEPSGHLAGVLGWFVLIGLPCILLPRILRRCKPACQGPDAPEKLLTQWTKDGEGHTC